MGCMGDSLVRLGHAGGLVAYAGPVGTEIPTRFGVVMSEKMYTVKLTETEMLQVRSALASQECRFRDADCPANARSYNLLRSRLQVVDPDPADPDPDPADPDPADSRVVRLCDAFEMWGADAIVERIDGKVNIVWQVVSEDEIWDLEYQSRVPAVSGATASVRLVARLSSDYSVTAGPVSVAGSLREAYELWGPCVVRDSSEGFMDVDAIEISPDGSSVKRIWGAPGAPECWDKYAPFTLVEQFSRDYTIFRERVTREALSFAADGRERQ